MSDHLEREASDGSAAEKLLNGIQPYFVAYSAELFQSLKRTNFKELDKREEIYRQLKVIDTVEGRIMEAVQTGKMAKQQLGLLERAKHKLKVL